MRYPMIGRVCQRGRYSLNAPIKLNLMLYI